MVADIFTAIGEIVTGFITVVGSLFSDAGILSVFYTEVGGLTILGTLLLLAFGYGLVRWAFSYVRNLIRMRG